MGARRGRGDSLPILAAVQQAERTNVKVQGLAQAAKATDEIDAADGGTP